MKQQDGKPRLFSFTLRDFLIFAAIFICALVLCTLLRRSDISDGFASPVFVLAVLLTSRFTNGYLFGTLAAFLSVIGINYIFTLPSWEFNFTMTGYPLTFFVMLCVSLVTCTMTTKIKQLQYVNEYNEVFVLSLLILFTNLLAKAIFTWLANRSAQTGKRNNKKRKETKPSCI